MKTLQTRFNLVLSTVLIITILLPILILYLLGKSGLVEATYVTEAQYLQRGGWPLNAIIRESLSVRPDFELPPSKENSSTDEWLLRLPTTETGTKRTQLSIVLDPVTGLWSERLATNNIERIVVSSPVFNLRVNLPAWLAIGTLPLFGLLSSFILSMVMSRSITHPISQLADAAKAIGQRELGYRVRTKGSKELIDLAQSFNRMAEQLEQAEINRRNLMADVAHELRTPLTVLDGNLRAMLDGVHSLDEEEIALLYEQTHHLNHLVDDLRDLSLAEANQLSLNCQEVDLAHLIGETVSHFNLIAHEQGIQLTSEVDSSLVHPCLDENRVRQILHNLLSNAFRHTSQNGSIHVSGTQMHDENAIEIMIADTGDGILPKDIPHIFSRFYRTEETIRNDRVGSGLGLAIVKAIVDALGGTIQVKSGGKDQGSTFTIRFPIELLTE